VNAVVLLPDVTAMLLPGFGFYAAVAAALAVIFLVRQRDARSRQ
jgi:PGF-CTERM protein